MPDRDAEELRRFKAHTAGSLREWERGFERLRGIPIMQSHGRADPILPFAAAERLRDLLKTAGADVRWVEFSGGHTIPMGALDALGKLVRDVFGVE